MKKTVSCLCNSKHIQVTNQRRAIIRLMSDSFTNAKIPYANVHKLISTWLSEGFTKEGILCHQCHTSVPKVSRENVKEAKKGVKKGVKKKEVKKKEVNKEENIELDDFEDPAAAAVKVDIDNDVATLAPARKSKPATPKKRQAKSQASKAPVSKDTKVKKAEAPKKANWKGWVVLEDGDDEHVKEDDVVVSEGEEKPRTRRQRRA
ncbi:uncharacterized protein MELLADRAFT_66342 [Melampsora larici-populina 98AG31]|uniref:Uncharacterized protein n=1 Tax=Melampsora larici-populina (strain 98AG31 / pathotype 3-4-7) TaxID=747676 RepID=F4RYT3_MELLP|nr:uncharacterized protein MELLADRAFT_66342 [Melampsora larici-populina 98AG31]EGG02302.1 hypothetical protein MELLADRAFT_66342 [Melampsora larici-populina 98AG31]